MGKNRTRENVSIMKSMIKDFVQKVLAEDVGRGDLYALVEPSIDASAKIIAKMDGVLAGILYLDVLAEVEEFEIEWKKKDGEKFLDGEVLATLKGDSHTLLRNERTFLNILLHASSIATNTRKYLDLIQEYDTHLLDTRKTRPNLRVFEKYATRCAGAVNHRMGLDDALMIKDTHLKTIKDLKLYIEKARKLIPFTTMIEVEAETLEMAKYAMSTACDIVMCDNMEPKEIAQVVQYRNKNFPHILLEASGNITLETIVAVAKTGVDAISSGSIVHQANWIDLSMKMD